MSTQPDVSRPVRADDPLAGNGPASVVPGQAILTIVAASFGAVGSSVGLFHALGRDWWMLLRDPAAAFGFAPYAGLFSHLGVLALATAGAISIFAAQLLRQGGRQRLMLLCAGLLSLWLAVDDLFMLHERVLPRLVGLPENVTLAIYVVLALGLMRLIGAALLTRRHLGLWVAGGFLVVMLVTDMLFEVATSASFLVEETAKFAGFVLWATFWIAEARSVLLDEIRQPADRR